MSNDPHNFDLVLDTHSLGLEIAAEVVIQAIEIGRTIAPAQDAGLHVACPSRPIRSPIRPVADAGSPDELDGPPRGQAESPQRGTADPAESRKLPGRRRLLIDCRRSLPHIMSEFVATPDVRQ